jgi:hypothetical protein
MPDRAVGDPFGEYRVLAKARDTTGLRQLATTPSMARPTTNTKIRRPTAHGMNQMPTSTASTASRSTKYASVNPAGGQTVPLRASCRVKGVRAARRVAGSAVRKSAD